MKKLIVLSVLVTSLCAEEPSTHGLEIVSLAKIVEEQPISNAQQLAKNEIESFLS